MKDNCVIKIEGLQLQDGDENNVKLSTRGHFVRRNGKYYITYKESEATGFLGCTTTVKVEGDTKVSMTRLGPAPSQIIIEIGNRNVCHYETGYGSFSLGISADNIANSLTDAGGDIEFTYLLDMNSTSVSKNTVKINVKPS